MSRLTVFNEDAPGVAVLRTEDADRIAAELGRIGVRFERWENPEGPGAQLSPQDSAETILAAYRPHLDRLMGDTGAGSADVIKLDASTPNKAAIRDKFLSEHTHTEDEVRFFVHGEGSFVMHVDGRVYDAHCTAGDLISVPHGIRHWFDAGETPFVTALRVFTETTGWVAHYTGDSISERFPVS